MGVAFYGSDLAASSLPIATSLCPDETDNCDDEDQVDPVLFLADSFLSDTFISTARKRQGMASLS